MDLALTLIESWRRQSQCLENLTNLLDEDLLNVKPSEEGWTVAYHLCHIHETRSYWLAHASGNKNSELVDLYHQENDEWFPSMDLGLIREQLKKSSDAIGEWLTHSLTTSGAAGPYDHPVFFLQHMIWHEGYHFGLLMLALRLAGHEPTEEWEDENVWGLWRNYG